MEVLLLVAAVICWGITAVLGFGWFGTHSDPLTAIGWAGLGLFFYGLFMLVPAVIARARPPA